MDEDTRWTSTIDRTLRFGCLNEGSYLRPPRFSCKARHEGYYADVASRCKVFHLCKNGVQYSFVCPKGTLFHEAISVCDWKSSVVCGAPLKKPPKHQPKVPKYRPHPRGGRHGPRRTEEANAPAFHVHYLLANDQTRKNKEKSLPMTLFIAGDLHDADEKMGVIPDTILYQHNHGTKPPPETIVYEHHKNDHPPIHDDIPNTLLYEHDPTTHEVPDFLVYEHQGIRENKHEKKANKSPAGDPQTLIFLVDEDQHGKDQNYLRSKYDPVEEAYFAEDEYDNLREFFVHADTNGHNMGHSSPNTRGQKTPRRPTIPQRHSLHIYDPHLHNLSEHSQNPDVLITLPKRTKYKPHRNEYFSKTYDSDESDFEKSTAHFSQTQTASTPLTLKPVTKSTENANGHVYRKSQVPNLSATDIMSSLFLQSLLVKALDQFSTTTTERPASTVSSSLVATSAVQANPRPAQLMASRLNVHDMSSGPYRYRTILRRDEEENKESVTIAPSITSVPSPKSEKLILKTEASPEILTESSMIVTGTVSISPPDTTSISTTTVMSTLNPFIEALMRIVNDSTIMISKDPMLMVMNNHPRAAISESSTTFTENNQPIAAIIDSSTTVTEIQNLDDTESAKKSTSVDTSSNNTNEQNVSIPSFVDTLNNVTLDNTLMNVTEETTKKMFHNASLPVDSFQYNYSVANNKATKHSRDVAHPFLKNLEIHVHVHTPEPAIQHKEEDYKIRQVTSSSRPYSVRIPAGHRIKSLFPPKILRTPYPQTSYPQTSYLQLAYPQTPYPQTSHHRTPYPPTISTTSGVRYLHRKPRLSFVPATPTTSYSKPQPLSTKPPLLIEHRLTESSSPEQYRHEESKPTGYRIKLPDTTTKSPIEYDIIVSRKPPVVDGEVIPTPNQHQEPLVSTSSPIRRPTQPSPITRPSPTRPHALTFVDVSPREPSPVNSGGASIPENVAVFSLNNLTYTHRPSISFGTFKPVQSINSNMPQVFRPTPFSPESHFPGYSIHSGSTLKIPVEFSTPEPVHDHVFDDAQQQVYQNSKVRHNFFNGFQLENDIEGFSLESQPDNGQSSNAYVINQHNGYFDGNIKALSAFNSLPDMFASSYSLPLPIQPHMN